MTLALMEEHLALAESVRGWAGHAAPAPVIRSAVDAEDHGAALYRDTLRPGLAAQTRWHGLVLCAFWRPFRGRRS